MTGSNPGFRTARWLKTGRAFRARRLSISRAVARRPALEAAAVPFREPAGLQFCLGAEVRQPVRPGSRFTPKSSFDETERMSPRLDSSPERLWSEVELTGSF
jgi:hypothetical protein